MCLLIAISKDDNRKIERGRRVGTSVDASSSQPEKPPPLCPTPPAPPPPPLSLQRYQKKKKKEMHRLKIHAGNNPLNAAIHTTSPLPKRHRWLAGFTLACCLLSRDVLHLKQSSERLGLLPRAMHIDVHIGGGGGGGGGSSSSRSGTGSSARRDEPLTPLDAPAAARATTTIAELELELRQHVRVHPVPLARDGRARRVWIGVVRLFVPAGEIGLEGARYGQPFGVVRE